MGLLNVHLSCESSSHVVAQAWAYANLTYEPPGELMEHIAEASERRLSSFSPQNASNLLWCGCIDCWLRCIECPDDKHRTASEAGARSYTPISVPLYWRFWCSTPSVQPLKCQLSHPQLDTFLLAAAGQWLGWDMRIRGCCQRSPRTPAPTWPTTNHSPSPTLCGTTTPRASSRASSWRSCLALTTASLPAHQTPTIRLYTGVAADSRTPCD